MAKVRTEMVALQDAVRARIRGVLSAHTYTEVFRTMAEETQRHASLSAFVAVDRLLSLTHRPIVPYPDNPEHVDNLCSFDLLEQQGFAGADTTLAISLYEYGLAWRRIGERLLVIYRIRGCGETRSWYDRTTLDMALDPAKEWNWVDWVEVEKYAGYDVRREGLVETIGALVSYYGAEEVFGTSYWEGFRISAARW